jgi:hypothetical protein
MHRSLAISRGVKDRARQAIAAGVPTGLIGDDIWREVTFDKPDFVTHAPSWQSPGLSKNLSRRREHGTG